VVVGSDVDLDSSVAGGVVRDGGVVVGRGGVAAVATGTAQTVMVIRVSGLGVSRDADCVLGAGRVMAAAGGLGKP